VNQLDDSTRSSLGSDYEFLFQYVYPRVHELRAGAAGNAGSAPALPACNVFYQEKSANASGDSAAYSSSISTIDGPPHVYMTAHTTPSGGSISNTASYEVRNKDFESQSNNAAFLWKLKNPVTNTFPSTR
jgi:hypothetical protein